MGLGVQGRAGWAWDGPRQGRFPARECVFRWWSVGVWLGGRFRRSTGFLEAFGVLPRLGVGAIPANPPARAKGKRKTTPAGWGLGGEAMSGAARPLQGPAPRARGLFRSGFFSARESHPREGRFLGRGRVFAGWLVGHSVSGAFVAPRASCAVLALAHGTGWPCFFFPSARNGLSGSVCVWIIA